MGHSLDEHEEPSTDPISPRFGVNREDVAHLAVAKARANAALSSAVFDQVKEQAVFALQAQGLSIRDIADQTGIPKSEVGRIEKHLEKHDALPTIRVMGQAQAYREAIREAWEVNTGGF